VPALLAIAAVLVQLAVVGWSAWSAAGAARAAARAEQVGAEPEAAARAALPDALAGRAEVDERGGLIRVEVRAPRLLPLLPAFEVAADAGLDPAAAPGGVGG
jgi:pilus assembly protein CpaE